MAADDSTHPDKPSDVDELVAGIRENDLGKVRQLLESCPRLQESIDGPHGAFGSPPIVLARNAPPMVDLLLEFGADINARSDWWAGSYGVLDEVAADTARELVKRGARIDLHAAVAHDWFEEVDRLLAENPDGINAHGPDGQRPLHVAVSTDMIDRLIANGADLNLNDLDHSATAAQYHVTDEDLCRRLLHHGATADIFMAACLGDRELATRLISEDPEAITHQVGSCPRTRRLQAQASNHIYFWKLRHAATPAEVAREFGHPAMAEWLIAQVPLPKQLVDACWRGDSGRVQSLLEADPDLASRLEVEDHLRLCDAAWNNRTDTVRLMLRSGFDRHIVGAEQMTPLSRAAFHGLDQIIALLLDGDNDPPLELKHQYGGTPLGTCLYGRCHSWRTDGNFPRAVELLCRAGARIEEAWLPDGDATIDALLRAEMTRRETAD